MKLNSTKRRTTKHSEDAVHFAELCELRSAYLAAKKTYANKLIFLHSRFGLGTPKIASSERRKGRRRQ
jgi:hypothetical protein